MNYIQANPEGVDVSIQRIQTHLYNKLGWANIDVFGRIYRINEKPNAFIKNNEYKEVFSNDKNTASIYFIVDDKHSTIDGISFMVKVKIVFLVDLRKITLETDTRPDSLVQQQAKLCVNGAKSFRFNDGLETGLTNVFKGFETKGLERLDLNPLHLFSLNGEISYSKKC